MIAKPGGIIVTPHICGAPARIALMFFAALVVWPEIAGADGGFFSSHVNFIFERAQQAFIRYDETNGTEDLIIQPHFEGDARDFGWIVPVPSLPELSVMEAQLFNECDRMTRPIWRNRDGFLSCSNRVEPDYDVLDGGTQIHDEQTVGIYQTLTVSADNAGVLTDSLTVWGYLHDGNQQVVQDALQHYIDRSWYFVAMKADTSQLNPDPHGYGGWWYGHLQPVRFVFASEAFVYPLRISAISSAEDNVLVMYTCTDHRMTFEGASTEYVNKLTADEMKAVQMRYPSVGALVRAGEILTKLRRHFAPQQMTGDLLVTPAASDEEYREVRYSGLPVAEGVMVAIAWLLLAWPWRQGRRTRQRSGRGRS